MPILRDDTDSWRVEGGRLINELPKARLDKMIARYTKQITNIDAQIVVLNDQKADAQTVLDRVNRLKGELNT